MRSTAETSFGWCMGTPRSVRLGVAPDTPFSSLTLKHLYPTFEAAFANLVPQLAPAALLVFDLIEGWRQGFVKATFVRRYTRAEVGHVLDRPGLCVGGLRHRRARSRLPPAARGRPEGWRVARPGRATALACSPLRRTRSRGAVWSARRPVKPEVAGSNPVGTAPPWAVHGRVAQLAERAPEKREVTGSTPVPTTQRWRAALRAGRTARRQLGERRGQVGVVGDRRGRPRARPAESSSKTPGVADRGHAHGQRAGDVGAAEVADVGGALGRDAAEAGEGVLEDHAATACSRRRRRRTTSGRTAAARRGGRGARAGRCDGVMPTSQMMPSRTPASLQRAQARPRRPSVRCSSASSPAVGRTTRSAPPARRRGRSKPSSLDGVLGRLHGLVLLVGRPRLDVALPRRRRRPASSCSRSHAKPASSRMPAHASSRRPRRWPRSS